MNQLAAPNPLGHGPRRSVLEQAGGEPEQLDTAAPRKADQVTHVNLDAATLGRVAPTVDSVRTVDADDQELTSRSEQPLSDLAPVTTDLRLAQIHELHAVAAGMQEQLPPAHRGVVQDDVTVVTAPDEGHAWPQLEATTRAKLESPTGHGVMDIRATSRWVRHPLARRTSREVARLAFADAQGMSQVATYSSQRAEPTSSASHMSVTTRSGARSPFRSKVE